MATEAITAETPQVAPRALRLAALMESINAASSAAQQQELIAAAEKLGLRLRPGFFIQRRQIHSDFIELVRAVSSEAELDEELRSFNFDELMY